MTKIQDLPISYHIRFNMFVEMAGENKIDGAEAHQVSQQCANLGYC